MLVCYLRGMSLICTSLAACFTASLMPSPIFKGGFREGFPYHSQWSSNLTAIFDGNRFLPFIDLGKLYGQLIAKKNLR